MERDPSNRKRNNRAETRDVDHVPKSIETVRKAWRRFRPIVHYLAVYWSNPALVQKALDCDVTAERAFGLARGFEDFLDKRDKQFPINLIRVPRSIAPVSLDTIWVSDAFLKEKNPPKVARYHQ